MPPIANPEREGSNAKDQPEELRQVARDLEALAGLLERQPVARLAVMKAERAGGPHDRFLAELAKGVIRSRREREKFFPDELFAEPAWDMLLDLFVQRTAGKPVQVTSALIAGAAPPSTALRWLSVLERRGLVRRTPSDSDGRAVLVQLTDAGDVAMRDYLTNWLNHLTDGLDR